MTSNDLKKKIRGKFPSLKKPLFGRDVIECRDGTYEIHPHEAYVTAYGLAWSQIENLQISYNKDFPDCDDFADMMLGLFKIEWWTLINNAMYEIPKGSPPVYGVAEGYNPQGENHNFSFFLGGNGMYVADYWDIKSVFGYKPMRMRF